jgi:hypothetical protein
MFVIKDWAGNTMNYGQFHSFDDAWEYLQEKFESEEDLQEYFVEFLDS